MRRRRNLIAFALPTTWAVAAAVAIRFPSLEVRRAAALLIGAAIAAMDLVLHEAAHGNLARSPSLNRWAGFLFGAPELVSVTAYRIYHLRHHRQRIPISASEGLLNGTPAYLLAVPLLAWRRGTGPQRRAIAMEYALIFCGGSLALAFGLARGAGRSFLDLWIYPLGLSVLITSVRGWTETIAAFLVGKGARAAARPLLRPVNRLICDHLEHHLRPGMPWYDLPALRAALREEHRSGGNRVSYLRFLWDKLESRAATTAKPLEVSARAAVS